MTATRPPRAPLPDWSEGLREGTESLSIRPDDGLPKPLAMGTSEGDTSDVLALPPSPVGHLGHPPNDDGPTTADASPIVEPPVLSSEDRTKVDVRLMRPRPPRPPNDPARAATAAAGAEDDGQSLVGSTLGSYRLLARIGKGGMGHVYRAEHVRLGREVALKLLRQDYAVRKDAVARFFQEARTVNRVRHRNIVDVTDFVELEDGTTFIIMELLTGQSLNAWVRTGIEVPRALGVLAQICEGLAAAHSVNVVHRDLKPDNVIITRAPDGGELVKLLDFGVAKLINQGDDDAFGVETAAGSVVGTPAYMSPEQAGGLPIDGRSDIYSLGAIMYELFSGQPMFRGRSFGEFVRKHLTEQPVPPRGTPRGGNLDPRIEAIILRAIEKEPTRRYQSVADMRDALVGLLTELLALNQSGQRRIAPLPGESGRMPAMFASPPSTMLPSRPPGPLGGGSSSADRAPLVDITMESEELSRPDLARRRDPRLPINALITGQRQFPQQRATPWYVWFIGGALAVGLGIGGATWYARSLEPRRAAAANPIAAPTLIAIRLRSAPDGASVFKEGSGTELCRTPCQLNLDPADLGGISVRPFVLKREGFADKQLVVDLQQPERDLSVTLTPLGDAGNAGSAGGLPGAIPDGAATPSTPGVDGAGGAAGATTDDGKPTGDSAQPTGTVETKPTGAADTVPFPVGAQPTPGGVAADNKRPARPRKGSGTSKAGADDDTFELPAANSSKPAGAAPKAGADDDTTPPDDATTDDKPTKPTTKSTKSGKIDSTETIDPFRPRP